MNIFLKQPQITELNFSDFENRIASISKFYENSNFNTADFDVIILGIIKNNNHEADIIRKSLYKLYLSFNIKILDLGNLDISQIQSFEDSTINIFLSKIISHGVKLITIGNSENCNLFFYEYFNKKNIKFSTTIVDSKIDIDFKSNNIEENFLNYFIVNKRIINDLTIVAAQNYLINPEYKKDFVNRGYNIIRLSQVQSNIEESEPYFRNSEIISFDLSSVRNSDAPGIKNSSPNGLFANEICKLGYYAGLSDKVKIFSLFEIDNSLDYNNITSDLAAQIIWHFLSALEFRKNFFLNKNSDYSTFFVLIDYEQQQKELKFVFCNTSKRWWFSIDYKNENKLFPCSLQDYELAKAKKISERILFYLKK